MYELSPIMVKFTEKHRLVKVKNKLQRFVYTLRVVTTRHIDVMLTCPALIGWALNSVWQTVTALQILYAFPDECLRNRWRSFYRFAVHLILSHFYVHFAARLSSACAYVVLWQCQTRSHSCVSSTINEPLLCVSVAGLIDSFIYHSSRAIKKKIELGKFSWYVARH